VSPRGRALAADVAVAAAFAASAAALFVLGDDRDGSWPFFLGWLAVHLLYGIASGSFWALLIVVTCPPLFVATSSGNGDDTPLWLQSAFVEAFYGVPFAFMGVLVRRIWELRRGRPELPAEARREDVSE
jgi:hypothetical protein